MGRRAKKAPVQTKKRVTLAKRFKCPFCANDDVVECKMNLREGIGSLECRLCGASYQMPIHHLHEPIDVFSEWLDDCETAQTGRPTEAPPAEESDDDIPEESGMTKPTKSSSSSSSNKNKTVLPKKAAAVSKPSYTDLGLGDSDDSDDDE